MPQVVFHLTGAILKSENGLIFILYVFQTPVSNAIVQKAAKKKYPETGSPAPAHSQIDTCCIKTGRTMPECEGAVECSLQ